MGKETMPFEEQKEKSLNENIELLNRAKNLKKRALKLMVQGGEKNENTKS